MRVLIRNGRLIDPAANTDRQGDLALADGRILGPPAADFQADELIDAGGLIVCPGLVDLSVRLREPGQTHLGTIDSETRAAAAGGVTSLLCPPDTVPVIDNPAVVELIHQRAEQAGKAHVYCTGALTHGLRGERLADMQLLKDIGCIALGNAGEPLASSEVLLRALEYAADTGILVMLTPLDPWLSAEGCIHDGAHATRLGLTGIPETAETIAIARCLLLVEQTAARVHFCRLSSARGAAMIASAREQGLPVSADVGIHNLHLIDTDMAYFDARYHLRPPLREAADREGLGRALVQGAISAICSDHQPLDLDSKLAPFSQTLPGASALELLLPLCLRLVDQGLLGLTRALALVTSGPAGLLGLDCGSLAPGSPADLCLFDPAAEWRVSAETLVSAGKNTPFEGQRMRGRVRRTLLGGHSVYQDRGPA